MRVYTKQEVDQMRTGIRHRNPYLRPEQIEQLLQTYIMAQLDPEELYANSNRTNSSGTPSHASVVN